MTTELKPCKNCGSKSQSWAFGNRVITGIQSNRLSLNDVEGFFYLGCDDCGETLQYTTADSVAEQMNTRATPDVPDLVRYSGGDIYYEIFFDREVKPTPEGEYVRYVQAAAVITDKDTEIVYLRIDRDKWKRDALDIQKRFKAKLTQINDQKSAGYIAGSNLPLSKNGAYIMKEPFTDWPEKYKSCVSLYAAPVASEAETIERYKKALQDIVNLDEAMGHEITVKHAYEAVGIASKALSGKEPS